MLLRRSVAFFAMSTNRACAGGVSWINQNHGNPFQNSLVGDKASQLVKRPFSKSFPLALSNHCPAIESLEILKSDSPPGAFCLGDDSFGNTVIRVFLKSRFFARHFLKVALSRLRSFLLKRFFKGVDLFPNLIHRFSGERFSIGVGGEIHDAHIDSEKLFRVIGCSVRNIDHEIQEKLPAGGGEIRLSKHLVPVERSVMAEDQRNGDPSVDSRKRSMGQGLERKESPVVFHGGMSLEGVERFLFRPVAVGDLGNGPDDHLGGEGGKPLPRFKIDQMVEFHLVRRSGLEGLSGNPVAGVVEQLHRLQKRFGLFFGRVEFDLQCFFHNLIIGSDISYVNLLTEKSGAFLPSPDETTIQERVSCAKY